ncbi:hypothetical protein AHAS_Ahas02G0176700 [Arachis hypogaea]
MDSRGITPSLVTLSILINCFCHLGLMDSAFSALSKIIKLGHDLNHNLNHPNERVLYKQQQG